MLENIIENINNIPKILYLGSLDFQEGKIISIDPNLEKENGDIKDIKPGVYKSYIIVDELKYSIYDKIIFSKYNVHAIIIMNNEYNIKDILQNKKWEFSATLFSENNEIGIFNENIYPLVKNIGYYNDENINSEEFEYFFEECGEYTLSLEGFGKLNNDGIISKTYNNDSYNTFCCFDENEKIISYLVKLSNSIKIKSVEDENNFRIKNINKYFKDGNWENERYFMFQCLEYKSYIEDICFKIHMDENYKKNIPTFEEYLKSDLFIDIKNKRYKKENVRKRSIIINQLLKEKNDRNK